MPLYEYQCTECGARVEVLQKLSDPPLDTCTTCGSAVTKLLSAPAFQFKGSGWYVTDYGSKKDTSSNGGSSADADGKKSSEKAKSDSSATKESSDSKKESPISKARSDKVTPPENKSTSSN